MKLLEYIHSPNVLNNENIFTLHKYEQLINYFTKNDNNNYIYLHYSQDFLENGDVIEFFRNVQNKVILISSPDIDFPPPKKPYKYDKYADFSKFPTNYLEINYIDKVHTELIPIIEENNLKVFVHAVSIYNPNVLTVPIGIFPRFNHFHFKTNNKEFLCYANFGLSIDRWFGNPRNEIVGMIKTKPFIFYENIISTEIANRNAMDFDYFYENISKSKFAICPRGCGIDTYRLWDCICLGCIPIVEKYGGCEYFTDLPILFIDSYLDYNSLSEDFLNQTYLDFLQRDFTYEKLSLGYWHNLILSMKNI
jgi:hypothetical protein